jgi:protein-tyrosine-phosphatase
VTHPERADATVNGNHAADLAQRLEAAELELAMLRDELSETNQGVVALYAELDDKAQQLRSVSELKSRFLSYMSHEFRTPLGAIRTLSGARAHAKQPAMAPYRILFVCLGNICRSPMAEGVFRRVVAEEGLSDRFVIDSAGLGDWHIGQAPDHRAQKAARTRGIDISDQSARQVVDEDFDRFDLLLVMEIATPNNWWSIQKQGALWMKQRKL